MLFNNRKLKKEFDSLPDNIKKSIESDGKEIKSADELKELVRRIRDAETGKLN